MFTVNSNPHRLEEYSERGKFTLSQPYIEDTKRRFCLYDFAAKDDTVFSGYSDNQESTFARKMLDYCFGR